MIIDSTYFQGKELYIPNALAQPSMGSNSPTGIAQLEAEIDNRESELLLEVLGFSQATELYLQFNEDGSWKADALTKWVDLVDGKGAWKGLRYTIGTKKVSLIAYYVFFYYLAQDYASYTTTGMQIVSPENSVVQAPNAKQTAVWNKFIQQYVGSRNITGVSFSHNWNGTAMSHSGFKTSNEMSLFEFLSNNRDLYDVSHFKSQSVINFLGL